MALFIDNHASTPINKNNPMLKENSTEDTAHFIKKRVKRYTREGKNFHFG